MGENQKKFSKERKRRNTTVCGPPPLALVEPEARTNSKDKRKLSTVMDMEFNKGIINSQSIHSSCGQVRLIHTKPYVTKLHQ
jgi:hypothetical protein